MSPSQVVNSVSLAFGALTKESEIIIGVKAKSHPYFRTKRRKGNLKHESNSYSFICFDTGLYALGH